MHNIDLFLQRMRTAYLVQLNYRINLINGGGNNAIILDTARTVSMAGGMETENFFQRIEEDLIIRRDPVGLAPLPLVNLSQDRKNRIRLTWTTKLFNMAKYQWKWINQSPTIAGVLFARMLADAVLKNYLEISFGVLKATVGNNSKTFLDATKFNKPANRRIGDHILEAGADMFGDASGEITTWLMPTSARTRLLINHLDNAQNLFTFDKVNIWRDASGRTIITTDDPNLRQTGVDGKGNTNVAMHWVFGLKRGAIQITELDDWDEITARTAGLENIPETYQGNWSSRFGVLGYKFNETLLSEADREGMDKYIAASNASLFVPANWSQVEPSHKTTAGVAIRVESANLIDDE